MRLRSHPIIQPTPKELNEFVSIMRAVRNPCPRVQGDAFDFVPSGPLDIARMMVDSPYVLSDFRLDGLKQEIVDGV